jgi:hypothetical protein
MVDANTAKAWVIADSVGWAKTPILPQGGRAVALPGSATARFLCVSALGSRVTHMTLRDLLKLIGGDTRLLLVVCGLPPLLALVTGFLHARDRGNATPWKYVYSACIYAACIPGLMATVVTTYAVTFAHENLLDLEASVYLLPIVSMLVTLVFVGMRADFGPLPGFGRLSGLMVMLGITFVIILFVSKTRIFLFFGGSIWVLVLFGTFVFALLKWGTYMAFRPQGAPEQPAPRFPGMADDGE